MRNLKKYNQRLTVLTLVVALGAAVYLNWEYARSGPAAVEADSQAAKPASADVITDALQGDSDPVTADKNYGEAQLVSVNTDAGSSFFEKARLSRTKTRDQALDTLKKSLKGSSLSQSEKDAITQKLSAEIENIISENELETLIKSKGFVDCVVLLDANKANVTVQTEKDGLGKEQVAQIRDAVLSRCDVSAQNITVVEVK